MYQDVDEVARDLALTDEDQDLLDSFLQGAAFERPDGSRYVTPEVIGKALAAVGDNPWRFLWRAAGCFAHRQYDQAQGWVDFATHYAQWDGFDARDREYYSLMVTFCNTSMREIQLSRESIEKTTDFIQERADERVSAE